MQQYAITTLILFSSLCVCINKTICLGEQVVVEYAQNCSNNTAQASCALVSSTAYNHSVIQGTAYAVLGAFLAKNYQYESPLRCALYQSNCDLIEHLWYAGVPFDTIEKDLLITLMFHDADQTQKLCLLDYLLLFGIPATHTLQAVLFSIPNRDYKTVVSKRKKRIVQELCSYADEHGLQLPDHLACMLCEYVVTQFEPIPEDLVLGPLA